jgi:hypothetical protein
MFILGCEIKNSGNNLKNNFIIPHVCHWIWGLSIVARPSGDYSVLSVSIICDSVTEFGV